jgi:hypothetical protein
MFSKKTIWAGDSLEHLGFAEALETLGERAQMQMRYHDTDLVIVINQSLLSPSLQLHCLKQLIHTLIK